MYIFLPSDHSIQYTHLHKTELHKNASQRKFHLSRTMLSTCTSRGEIAFSSFATDFEFTASDWIMEFQKRLIR